VHRAPFFREFSVRLPGSASSFVRYALDRKILAGVPLAKYDGARPNDLLVAVTEKRSKTDMDQYADVLAAWALAASSAPAKEAACPR
jgi:glycine dehydrogenase subunit 1